ncbi:MAG: molybdate ABC transporter substrate-binding protein [Epsilonproteobacteria bacterium]|nr:molybdate ABC transporter substrate-binding protein [Campylobacterota bacterium]
MRKIFLTLLFSLPLFANSITVAVAANTSFVIPKLIQEFKKTHPNLKFNTIMASSGKLTAQIERGAPFELFLSADMKYPTYLYQKGLTQNPPKVYAKGKLVFVGKKATSLNDLLTLSKIAIPNPKTAPYGKAAYEVLKKSDLLKKVKNRLIYGESVSQTLTYATKVAEGGFISKSALFSPTTSNLNYFEINSSLYSPIQQGVVVLKNASLQAKEFFNFLFSKEAKEILKKFGYSVD